MAWLEYMSWAIIFLSGEFRMVMGVEVGILASYKELGLGGPNGPCTCLRYEAMETVTKQRKSTRKESGRGMEALWTHQRKGKGLRKRRREQPGSCSSCNLYLVFFQVQVFDSSNQQTLN